MKRFLIWLLLTGFVFAAPMHASESRFGKLLKEFPGYSRFGKLVQSTSSIVRQKVLGLQTRPQENQQMKIVILGDSMVDVLGEDLSYLRQELENYFPNIDFQFYNYGVGATDIEYGYERLTESYQYKNKRFPPLLSIKPDILIIESFAYNNFGYGQEGLDKHWLLIAEIIGKVREATPGTKIILAATIGPNSKIYGDGISGLHWNQAQKLIKAETVRQYLSNMVNFAESQGYPLVNAYRASVDISGEGRPIYIDPEDNLHPSKNGKELFCEHLADKIKEVID